MDGLRTFELKVGIFILIGIFILFVIVFLMGDLKIAKSAYHIKAVFSFASGVGPGAPVRLAGVGIGQIDGIKIIYDDLTSKTKAEITAWIQDGTKIEEDATFTINTLGLLGEKYLEVYPGTPGKGLLKDKAVVTGRDPIPMEKVTENLATLSDSVKAIVDRLNKGEGTIGKLLKEDAVYDDVKAITGNFKDFSEDIKRHPWKLLNKPKGE